MIFRNAERFLAEAVASVRAQTYPCWELLLVDDGSRDGGPALARELARRDPERIRCLEHPGRRNRGMSASRNLGIRCSSGPLIALLDADDVWLPEKLARQVAALQACPEAGMAYGPTRYWYGWTGAPEDAQRDFLSELGAPAGGVFDPPRLLRIYLENRGRPPGTCSVLLRRQTVGRVGGFVESFRGMYEDQAFFAKVTTSVPVLLLAEPTALYRQHAASACAVAESSGGFQLSEDAYLRWLARHLSTLPQRGGDWDAIRSLLEPYRHPWRRRVAAAARALGERLKRGPRGGR